MAKLRAAVIGAGYLGKFHAQKYASLTDVELVGVVDTRMEVAQDIAAQCKTKAYSDYRDILGQIDLVSIVVPTEHHFTVACACLDAGVHILVEKPVTQTVDEASKLIQLANARRLAFQVGHLERFNPALLALQDALVEPMFIESHRLAAFKPRGTDVNVVLDLMIHDIDIILSIVHSPITAIRAVGIPVLTEEVDIANARLEFKSGCVANVTASRVSQSPMRKMRIFQPSTYISIDYQDHNIAVYRKNSAQLDARGMPKIESQQKSFEQTDALMHEISTFVEAVKTGSTPLVTGEDGKRALEVALEINRKMKERVA
jgi:predicted dehydrogenase